jgi:hypothetical protein
VGYDGDYDDRYGDLHDECVPRDEVVSYAFQNHGKEIEDQVRAALDDEWLSQNRPFIDLLSAISQRDRAHMQGAIKRKLRRREGEGIEAVQRQLFDIAADVASFLEQLETLAPAKSSISTKHPDYHRMVEPTADRCIVSAAGKCTLGDDLTWAKDLLAISRSFRDFLSAVSECDAQDSLFLLRVREPIETLNSYLKKAPGPLLVYWQGSDRQFRFGRSPDPELHDLSTLVANWLSDYLTNYYPRIGFGVCAECGKLFSRERRDRTFCSKSCQNRVAYKRKRILESDALVQTNISADDACEIAMGLWMHHPRFGIGRVESVSCENTPMATLLKGTANRQDVRFRSMLSRRIRVEIRFLHGTRRFGFSDLFEGQKTEDQLPTFYRVKSEETLAEFL